MNTALFASAFHPHMGGVEEHVRQVAHAFRRGGNSPIVLTIRWPRSLPAFEVVEGIPVYRLAMRVPDGSRKSRLAYQLTSGFLQRQMLAILRRHRCEVLHVHCVSLNGFYALHAQHALGLPLVLTTHGERTMDASGLYQRSAFMNGVLRDLLGAADAITACSRHTLDDMEEYWGRPFGERASVVYNGIDPGEFAGAEPFAHPRPYVLALGRLVPQKGFDLLLKAFARANPAGCDLILAGDGPERGPLAELVGRLGLEGRVHLIGRANRAKAGALFKGCQFFVLPSRIEPMGIVSLEAMACGKAVLAARVGGVPEVVVEGQTGCLFRGEDIDAMAAGITRLAGDAALCARFGSAGRERSASFTWEATASRYLDLYQTLPGLTQAAPELQEAFAN